MLNSKSKEMLKLCSKIARRLNSTSTPSLLRCRHLSQTNGLFDTNSSRNNEKSNTLPATKWDKIYNMDEINFLGIVSKLKLYQGIASVITIPSSYIGEILAIVPHGTTQAVFAMSLSTCVMLCAYSALVNNTIGIIYVCTKNISIRFAYLDFWGQRKHYETTIDNIIESNGKSLFGLWQTVNLRDGKKTFKLATRHGHITDFDLYEKLFGRPKQ